MEAGERMAPRWVGSEAGEEVIEGRRVFWEKGGDMNLVEMRYMSNHSRQIYCMHVT